MIRLTDLAGNGSFTMGGKKFEYGKVYSNPYATAFKSMNERVDMNALSDELKRLIKKYPGKQITYSFITNKDYPKGYVFFINGKILKEAEGSEDHEVSMAQNQLDSIIKSATELKQKMGEEEKQIPAWIQDHITNSENYISQAASNYHEYGDSNEVKADEIKVLSKEEFQNEASPCWKGYKQVGMKNKNGKQVPNCVPNESVVREAVGVPKMYVKYAAVQKKVRELEEKQKAMAAKYFAEKDPKKKQSMMILLKKGTEELAARRRNLADIEEKYINNLYKDVELDTSIA